GPGGFCQIDVCEQGECLVGQPYVCTPSGPCRDAGVCDPETGLCSDPISRDGSGCNDGDACTREDTCVSGICTGADPAPCTGTCTPGVDCEPQGYAFDVPSTCASGCYRDELHTLSDDAAPVPGQLTDGILGVFPIGSE